MNNVTSEYPDVQSDCLILYELTMAQFITCCHPHCILNTKDLYSNFKTVLNFNIQSPPKCWIRREAPVRISFVMDYLLVMPLSHGLVTGSGNPVLRQNLQ